MVPVVKNIFAEGRSPSRIRTDKGQEFRSQLVVSFETETDRTFVQNTEIKANYVERLIKTIKLKMYRYFTYAQSYNYIGELQKFAGSYKLQIRLSCPLVVAAIRIWRRYRLPPI
jgi:hypothetical protein